MKKLLSVFMICLISTIAFGQTKWEVNYFKDAFGDPDPSAGGYVSGIVEDGTFSNSATTNSDLIVILFAEEYEGTIVNSIKLIEYGSSIVKAYSTTPYIIKIKDDSGGVHTIKSRMLEGGDSIYNLSGEDINELILSNDNLKFFIKEGDAGYASTYKFSLSTENYESSISKIKTK
jgi:hypothetical protein